MSLITQNIMKALEASRMAYRMYAQMTRFPVDPFYRGIYSEGFEEDRLYQQKRRKIIRHIRQHLSPRIDEPLDPLFYDFNHPNTQESVLYKDSKWNFIKLDPMDLEMNMKTQILIKPESSEMKVKNIDNSKHATCLYFQGRTGMTTSSQGVWSPMGFVYFREDQNTCIISFRGSRSGSFLAMPQALVEGGNPDWVTDLKSHKESTGFYTGFHESFLSCKNSIEKALSSLPINKDTHLLITGHSLGGALAQHCYLDLYLHSAIIKREHMQCLPISSPPIFIDQKSIHQYKIDNNADDLMGKNIKHIGCSFDPVHVAPSYSEQKKRWFFYNIPRSIVTKKIKGTLAPGAHIGEDFSRIGYSHEISDVYNTYAPDFFKKSIASTSASHMFWPKVNLDKFEDSSKLEKSHFRTWNLKKHRDLICAYFETDAHKENFESFHTKVIEHIDAKEHNHNLYIELFELLTEFEQDLTSNDPNSYISLMRLLLLAEMTFGTI